MIAPLLSVDGLCKHFTVQGQRVDALREVSFSMAAGEVLGLVGESGSGKSTIGKVVAGIYSADAGRVQFNGEPQPAKFRRADFRKRARQVQMVFQDTQSCLNPRFTVADSLEEPLQLQGIGKQQRQQRLVHWMARVGLPLSMLQRYPAELSGGQRQRVGIARAFIAEPELVICDEAISALDVSVQAQIVNLLRTLVAETGVAILFIAHDLAMVRYLCDRCLVLCNGELVEQGDTAALFKTPGHDYTRKLLAAHPAIQR